MILGFLYRAFAKAVNIKFFLLSTGYFTSGIVVWSPTPGPLHMHAQSLLLFAKQSKYSHLHDAAAAYLLRGGFIKIRFVHMCKWIFPSTARREERKERNIFYCIWEMEIDWTYVVDILPHTWDNVWCPHMQAIFFYSTRNLISALD